MVDPFKKSQKRPDGSIRVSMLFKGSHDGSPVRLGLPVNTLNWNGNSHDTVNFLMSPKTNPETELNTNDCHPYPKPRPRTIRPG
ncbi:JM80 [macacine gammaherpesvirus 11]|uniref:JM80 n=2 Tax=macacine gammaherpesvirus 11 TaxID=2560570 RepID=G9JM88_9GAMA|nr:JM80 [Macaca fuscata rhadinovirus]AAT00057.1 JM80 [Macaca fuscata rhadinovirus]AEW87605.1 JM80 [Macaca fuscata rhadinovirus]AEW87775.1 JM80 [Macaca fuscata rhadinovirus]